MRIGTESHWGKRKDFGEELPNRIRNSRHLLNFEDKCITVSDNIPIVEIYDLKSKQMVDSLDFSDIDYIKKDLIKNENIRKLNSYTKIVSDAYVDGNYLYVLLFGTGSSGEVLSNERKLSNYPERIIYISVSIKIVFMHTIGRKHGLNY